MDSCEGPAKVQGEHEAGLSHQQQKVDRREVSRSLNSSSKLTCSSPQFWERVQPPPVAQLEPAEGSDHCTSEEQVWPGAGVKQHSSGAWRDARICPGSSWGCCSSTNCRDQCQALHLSQPSLRGQTEAAGACSQGGLLKLNLCSKLCALVLRSLNHVQDQARLNP